MTGQVVAAALIAAVIVAVLPWLLLRDLRRARYRRDPWSGWIELGWTTEDDDVPAWLMHQGPIRVGYDPGIGGLAALAIETRIGLSVLRPEAAVKIVDVL